MTVKQNRDAGITPVEMTSSKSSSILHSDSNEEQEGTSVSATTGQILLKMELKKENQFIKSLSKPQSIVRPMPKTTTTNIITNPTTYLATSRKSVMIEKRKPELRSIVAAEERGRRRRKVQEVSKPTTTVNNIVNTTRTLRIQKTQPVKNFKYF